MSLSKNALYLLSGLVCSVCWLGVLIGCGPPEGDVTIGGADEPEALYFESFARGPNALFPDTTELVVRDSAAWSEVQTRLRSAARYAPIDFSQSMVVLAAVPTPAGGYLVDIDAVEVFADTILVTYVLSIPGEDCLAPQHMAVPFQAVLARRTEGPARFIRRLERLNCRV